MGCKTRNFAFRLVSQPCCETFLLLVVMFVYFCRYELPGINAFNFVLEDALGGGGVASLRSDPQVSVAAKICSKYLSTILNILLLNFRPRGYCVSSFLIGSLNLGYQLI